jgi:hypothetical protein
VRERERERDLYPLPITAMTHAISRGVVLLNYYEEVASLKGHIELLVHLISLWDVY